VRRFSFNGRRSTREAIRGRSHLASNRTRRFCSFNVDRLLMSQFFRHTPSCGFRNPPLSPNDRQAALVSALNCAEMRSVHRQSVRSRTAPNLSYGQEVKFKVLYLYSLRLFCPTITSNDADVRPPASSVVQRRKVHTPEPLKVSWKTPDQTSIRFLPV
jgi:hypothetical protein